MLKMISWMSFLSWMGILAVAYYLVMFARYYQREIVGFLTGKTLKARPSGSKEQPDDKKPEFFTAMEKAIDALTESLQEVTASAGNREDALVAIKEVLRKFAYLKGTPYEIAIHHFLLRETYQSVQLNEDEVKGLWD
jgi:hypothetical protein